MNKTNQTDTPTETELASVKIARAILNANEALEMLVKTDSCPPVKISTLRHAILNLELVIA